jgi:colanic acid biosynthesis glycosyl transferase WcaI
MNLLFLTPYFPPEVGAAQTRIHELAVRLARMGHRVSVLTTFPNYPSGVVPKEWRGKFFWKCVDEGIHVYRIWSYAVPNKGFLKRILGQLSFAFFASCAAPLLPRCEAIIVESPPLFDGLAGLFLSAMKRAPYLFTVSDLWPESAIQMGVLKNPVLIWLSKQIEMLFYRRAAAVFAVTQGIRRTIVSEGIDSQKVVLFRAGVDTEFFLPNMDGSETRRMLGISPRDFLVLYAGTLGMAHNLSAILEAASLFQSEGNNNMRFVLAGDGAEKQTLKDKARILGLNNLTFLDPVPKARMPFLLNAADCVVVSVRDLEIFRGALPTKLFEAMSCAKPVVLAVAGEAEEAVRSAESGYCVTPGDSAGIHNALLALAQDPANAAQMGKNGREFVVQHFSRDSRAQELNECLLRLASNNGEQDSLLKANLSRATADDDNSARVPLEQ